MFFHNSAFSVFCVCGVPPPRLSPPLARRALNFTLLGCSAAWRLVFSVARLLAVGSAFARAPTNWQLPKTTPLGVGGGRAAPVRAALQHQAAHLGRRGGSRGAWAANANASGVCACFPRNHLRCEKKNSVSSRRAKALLAASFLLQPLTPLFSRRRHRRPAPPCPLAVEAQGGICARAPSVAQTRRKRKRKTGLQRATAQCVP